MKPSTYTCERIANTYGRAEDRLHMQRKPAKDQTLVKGVKAGIQRLGYF